MTYEMCSISIYLKAGETILQLTTPNVGEVLLFHVVQETDLYENCNRPVMYISF